MTNNISIKNQSETPTNLRSIGSDADPKILNELGGTIFPKVSTIIPTFNRSDRLQRALASLAKIPNHSTYVFDNQSSVDHQEENKRLSRYYGAKYILREKNIGGLRNYTQSVKEVGSEYIHLLSDDNEVVPDGFLELMMHINGASAHFGIYVGLAQWINEDTRYQKTRPSLSTASIRTTSSRDTALFVSRHTITWDAAIIRREAFIRALEELSQHDGSAIAIDLLVVQEVAMAEGICFCPTISANYYIHGENMSKHYQRDPFRAEELWGARLNVFDRLVQIVRDDVSLSDEVRRHKRDYAFSLLPRLLRDNHFQLAQKYLELASIPIHVSPFKKLFLTSISLIINLSETKVLSSISRGLARVMWFIWERSGKF